MKHITTTATQANVLNLSLLELMENCVHTWSIVIATLLSPDFYLLPTDMTNTTVATDQWWIRPMYLLRKAVHLLSSKEHILYVGVGFVILSFLLHFILVAE
jgi:hypothetical protein